MSSENANFTAVSEENKRLRTANNLLAHELSEWRETNAKSSADLAEARRECAQWQGIANRATEQRDTERKARELAEDTARAALAAIHGGELAALTGEGR